jgi:predicted transcriptional regulator
MLQKEQKSLNDKLRRNIWRSLLIMKSASVSELLGVVTGLTVRKARAILRELETHGYVGKNIVKGRRAYFQATDSPSLPAVCSRCNRPFHSKACAKKETKRQTQRKTQRDRETLKQPTVAAEPAAQPTVSMEVHHDAA